MQEVAGSNPAESNPLNGIAESHLLCVKPDYVVFVRKAYKDVYYVMFERKGMIKPVGGVYDEPRYYDIAWGKGTKSQVDYFEKVVKRYGRARTHSFLDIACGTSPQLIELARRGYDCTGLDINTKMLLYLNGKAKAERLRIHTVRQDMHDFKLRKKYDFAFVLSDSLDVISNSQFLQHLSCVSDALYNSGLYLIENMSFGNIKRKTPEIFRKGNLEITWHSVEDRVKNDLEQLYMTDMNMDVKEDGKVQRFHTEYPFKVFYPQEFKSLIELNGKFKFVGWFEHLSFRPLRKMSYKNIMLLKKI